MKTMLIILFSLFLISCQTTQPAKSSAPSGEEDAGDLIAEGSQGGEEDLESEFTDSEDFEKEMTESAFPSEEGEEGAKNEVAQKEQPAEDLVEDIDEEDEDFSEFAEDSTPPTKEEEGESTPTEDIAEAEPALEEDIEEGRAGGSNGIVEVQNIRYSAEENKIYIDGTGAFSYQQRENKANNQFIIEIESAVLSESLRERPFIMKDFNTDMALLMADQKDSATVRIVVQMRENASMPSASVEEGGGLVISSAGEGGDLMAGSVDSTDGFNNEGAGGGDVTGEILPAKSLEDFFLKTPRFTGRPISIHFKEVDIKDVLYFISEGTGLNMVLDDGISGNISIKLRNVPWDQALITVMKTKKLGYVREGNVIRIMQLDSLKKNQKDIQEMLESQKVLEPLKVKVIPIAYAKVGEIQKHAELFLSKESRGPAGSGSAGGGGGGAQRGKIVVDTQNNSLIVVDTEKSIKRIEALVKSLDRSPTQVMIEAKVVEANENFVRDVGINWKYDGEALRLFENTPLSLNIDGGLELFSSESAGGGTSNTQLNLHFAPLGNLDINLGLSEVEGSARVISAPRVMVLNGETATITQSSESLSPKATTTEAGTTISTERSTANLEFKVTPQITSLGSIFMDIDVTRAFFGQRDTVTRARPTFTRSAKTKVLVNNGQTVVIGGIYQYDEQKGEDGFPILRHIPILNWFFTRWTLDKQKNELLLFLTPRALEWTAQKAVEIN